MSDIIRTYQERFRRSRHALRRYTALLLALALITTLFVNWQLHGVGISMTADYQCGEVEHTHTASCYTRVLVCGYEEGELENPDQVAGYRPADTGSSDAAGDSGIALYDAQPQVEWVPHEHTADCYTEVQTLTCLEEEHVHTDDCFDPEDGRLICDKFEHTHDESCYTTEQELTCGLEEGELVEQVVEPTESAALFEMATAQPVVTEEPVDTVEPVYHHHTDACYEEVLTCPFPEHHHTVNCLSDSYADVETEEEWLQKTDTTLDGLWADDLLTVAKSQLGYEQSERNFQLDGDDNVTVRHYTRYGQAYGNPYGEWDVMFLSYCLRYAEIPQTAVPQEAGVLALRSAMKGMEWLQDVDGTEAVPGDIVIYKKEATRTVAVEQPTKQEETSVENSVADYGIAALPADAAAAKPVVVDDTALADATAPQTTTETSTVDTVGIVESIDEETGTLTVISGDVDGKVAEVQLAPAEVESVIGLTAAQLALSGDSFTTLEGSTGTVDYKSFFTETPEGSNKGGVYDYTVVVNNIEKHDGVSLTVGQKATLKFWYKIEEGTLSKTNPGGNVLHYTLPEGLWPPQTIEKDIYDASGEHVIGKQTFNTDGTSVLVFNSDQTYVDIEKQFEGVFAYDWTYTSTSTNKDETIKFPGSNSSITLKKQQDLSIEKKSSGITEVNGKPTIHYTVEVNTVHGWDEDDITIKDTLSITNASTLDVAFENFTLKKFEKDATTGTDYPGFSAPTPTKRQYESKYDFETQKLNRLQAGEKYVLEYDVILTNTSGKGWQQISNQASTNDNKQSNWSQETNLDHLAKEGSYDEATEKITWTVKIYNPNGADLNGDVVKDTLKTAGSKVDEKVELWLVKDENGNGPETKLTEFEPNADRNGFEYKFDSTKVDTKGREYRFVYKTTVPDGATNVSNGAEYERGESKYTDGSSVNISDNNLTVKKTASSATGIVKSTEHDGLYEAAWKIEADLPRSVKTYTIQDWIDPGYNAEGNLGRMDHYALAKDLQDQIENNLKISCTNADGTTTELGYQELLNNGLKITIKYSGNQWDINNEKVEATDNSKKVQRFEIAFDTTNYTGPSLKKLTLPYHTLVDTSKLDEGGHVQIKNTANNVSAQYDYTKPSTDVKIVKGAWSSNQYREPCNSYGGISDTTTIDYSNGNYIGYQVVMDLSSLEELGTMTLKDTLPVGLKYVAESTSVTFGKANRLTDGASSCKWQLPTKNGGTYDLSNAANQAAFEPSVTVSTDPDKGDVLTFSWNWTAANIDFAALKSQGYRYLALRYKVSMEDDARWNILKTDKIDYVNRISYGTDDRISAESTTTVKRDTKVLTKESTQITTKKNESRVHYTLTINPAGLKLGDKDKITLTDILTVQSPGVQAELDLSSVKLYNYPKTMYPNELDPTSYQFTAPVQSTNASGQRTYTMTFTLDNETPYVLEYEYVTDATADVKLRNDAELTGGHTHYTEKTYTEVGGSSKAYQKTLTIHKVDDRNETIHLPDATFELWYFDKAEGVWKNMDADGYTTGADGKLIFYYTNNPTKENQITDGVLYRLQETDAPDGYQKDSSYFYFLYRDAESTTVSTDLEAYTEAVGSCAGDSNIPVFEAVTCYSSDVVSNDKFVHNVADSLVINKRWLDVNGLPVAGSDAPLAQVTVRLYKYKPADTAVPHPETDDYVTITLDNSNNWSYTYKDPNDNGLEEGYRYYIVEQLSGSRFDVNYNAENTQGVGAGGVLTVTNKDTGVQDYELPSTGGTGTLPFTAVGGTMMLAALVYGVRRKRRHEGRAD